MWCECEEGTGPEVSGKKPENPEETQRRTQAHAC